MSTVEKEFEEITLRLVDEDPYKAMQLLTAHFVGLLCGLAKVNGCDPDQEIHVDGGNNRDITVHAKKDEDNG